MVQSPSKAWAIITAEDGKVTIMVVVMMTIMVTIMVVIMMTITMAIMVTFMRFQVTDSPKLILLFPGAGLQFSSLFTSGPQGRGVERYGNSQKKAKPTTSMDLLRYSGHWLFEEKQLE